MRTLLHHRAARLLAAASLVATIGVLGAAPTSVAAPTWAPAASATIHPGVQLFTDGAQCTANFIFSDGTNTYIGQAAHCQSTGASTDTDGCTSGSLPLGTPVDIGDTGVQGTIVYSSWLTMQANHETDANACAYNDIALVKIPASAVGLVNPSVPSFGGPTGVGPSTTSGQLVYSYGNSELRAGISLLSPQTGLSFGDQGNGWSHEVYTLTPGIPGDSGSGFLNANGQAIGVLSTLTLLPTPGSNNVSDLGHMLAYMHSHGGPNAHLVTGTQAFHASLLGLVPLG
jgi:hypothetical protein